MRRPIPIENIYYLFCYAWDRFPEGKNLEVGKTESPEIWDLFASVLARGVKRLIRRGLSRDYIDVEEDTSTVRGRIIVGDTLRHGLLMFGRARCRFDELQHDVLHNQIIKASLRNLSKFSELQPELRHELSRIASVFREVSDVRLSTSLFRRIQLSRNNANYDLLLKICELVHTALLPNPHGSGSKFYDILDNDKIMPGVFEAFVRNFLKAEQRDYAVGSERIQWDVQSLKAEGDEYIPSMQTDITLRSKSRTIIIDTKYYPEALVEHRGRKRIRSDHLYQLFAYLKNSHSRSGDGGPAEGILLYPTTSQSLDLSYSLNGHGIRVCTIQLGQPWPKIHADLCRLVS